jgi:tetratricopeptide (TPR) repeat protein
MRQTALFLGFLLALTAAMQAQAKEVARDQYAKFVIKGDSAYKAGDYADGATWYMQALAIDDKRSTVLIRTACCFSMTGHPKEANEYIMQLMNQNWEQGCKVVVEKKELSTYRESKYWQAIAPECEALLEAFDISATPSGGGGAASPGTD